MSNRYYILFSLVCLSLVPVCLFATPPSQLVTIPGIISKVDSGRITVQYSGNLRPVNGDHITVPHGTRASRKQEISSWKITHVNKSLVKAIPIYLQEEPVPGMAVEILTLSESDRKRIHTTTYFDPRFGFLLHTLQPYNRPPGFQGELSGLYVYSVADGSPAAQAGIRAGDIVLEANHGSLPRIHARAFEGVSGSFPEGAQVLLKVLRGTDEIETVVFLNE